MQQFQRRQFTLYSRDQLDSWLQELGFSLDQPTVLAKNITELSNVYNSGQGSPEIWSAPGFLAAYLAYFQPLNYLRLEQVIADGESCGFWQGLTQIVDYGAGLGTFEWALRKLNPRLTEIMSLEPSSQAIQWQVKIGQAAQLTSRRKVLKSEHELRVDQTTLIGFSYSLNEMTSLPKMATQAEALLFIEPSTMEAGRRLQQLRAELISQDFYAWAPCLHQQSCPLLVHSKKDWCHTRLHIQMPEWFLEIEKHLPMKNQSVTYSYLLLRKTPPRSHDPNQFRIIGDTLYEKGKVRQAICASDRRQFFSWLKKQGEAPMLPRGALVTVNSELIEKGDELRSSDSFEYKIN